MTVQNKPGVPVGGFKTIGQIDATNTLSFEEHRNGMSVALDLLSTHTAGAPVVDDQGKYLGFINEFDVMRALDRGTDLNTLQAKDIMRKDRLMVTEATPIPDMYERYLGGKDPIKLRLTVVAPSPDAISCHS